MALNKVATRSFAACHISNRSQSVVFVRGKSDDFHPTIEPGTEPKISKIVEKNSDLDFMPRDFYSMERQHMDFRYRHPPGNFLATRLFTQQDYLSPVYSGVARKLGYKTNAGFQRMS